MGVVNCIILLDFKGLFQVQNKLSAVDNICGMLLITTDNNFVCKNKKIGFVVMHLQ